MIALFKAYRDSKSIMEYNFFLGMFNMKLCKYASWNGYFEKSFNATSRIHNSEMCNMKYDINQ